MHIRRVSAALAAAALSVGLAACATQVAGTPVAGGAAPQATSKSPTSTRATSTRGSSTASTKSSSSQGQSSGPVKITNRKKGTPGKDCDLLTQQEWEAALGAKLDQPPSSLCVLTTSSPTMIVSAISTIADKPSSDAQQTEIGGNTAYQSKESDGSCKVQVMLTDNDQEVINALEVSVLVMDGGGDGCALTTKLAGQLFDRLPNG